MPMLPKSYTRLEFVRIAIGENPVRSVSSDASYFVKSFPHYEERENEWVVRVGT